VPDVSRNGTRCREDPHPVSQGCVTFRIWAATDVVDARGSDGFQLDTLGHGYAF
jgi:hypothetical protein